MTAPLVGKELLEAVRAMDSRLAATPASLLAMHDQRTCGGLMRRWTLTVDWCDALGISEALTATDLHEISSHLPEMVPFDDDPQYRPGPRRKRR